MGVGFTMTVDPQVADALTAYVNDNFRNRIEGVDRKADQIGTIVEREKRGPKFMFVNEIGGNYNGFNK